MKKLISAVLALIMSLSLITAGTQTAFADTPAQSGKVFAGYFTDDTESAMATAETAYPKFVDEAVLTVKYQLKYGVNENDTSTKLRVVTSVDSTHYRGIGFYVSVGGAAERRFETNTVAKKIIGTGELGDLEYEPSVFSSESKYFCAYNFSLSSEKFGTGLAFTPFWVTMDGTEVRGASRTIKVNESDDFNNVLISNADELRAFSAASQTNNYEGWKIKLTADIDLNPGFTASTTGFTDGNSGTPTQWTPIGSTSKYFKGTFDGQGHTISGMYLNTGTHTGTLYQGLFGATSGVSTVKNFRLENSYIYTKGARNGSIAGDGCGNFENIYSNAIIVTEGGNATAIGGMIGFFDGGTNVSYSGLEFAGTVTGSGYWVGGILGQASNSANTTLTIVNCKNSGSVSSSDIGAGSMVGIIDGLTSNTAATVNITGCWNSGSVSAPSAQGIFIGRTRNGSHIVNITDSLSTFASSLNPVGSQQTGTVNTLRCLGVRSGDVKIWPDSGEVTSVAPSELTAYAAVATLTPHGFDFASAWAVQYGGLPVPAAFSTVTLDRSWYGDGTASEFILNTAGEMYDFALVSQSDNFEGKTVKLGADIDLNPGCTASAGGMTGSPLQWTSIGSTSKYFKGTFDGQGHTISGLYQNSTTHTGNLYLGLFGATAGASTVKNFRLENSYIYTKGARNGSIAGNGDGNFADIYSNAFIVTEGGNAAAIGGMIGFFDGSTNVTYSGLEFSGTVTGSGYWAGGILGRASNGAGNTLTIQNCKMSGSVSSTDSVVGGIIGLIDTTASSVTVNITGCWTSGSVEAPSARGTIIGTTRNGSPVINITDCLCSYATPYNPIGSENILANYRRVMFVRSDYAKVYDDAGVKSDVIDLADLKGAVAETTLTAYGFDFSTTWTVRDGDFPVPYFFR